MITEKKKLLVYKILAFVFAFFVAFMPATASRSSEVNSRVIVEILGIDGGDKISVTAQYVMPTETQGATSKDAVTVEGDTLTEAVEYLNTALGRRAELGHCSLVVVGKELDTAVLGTLMTATDVTADVYVCAADDKADELVGKITDFMKKTGATDADFIAYSAKKAHVATNTLLGFLSDLNSASKSAYLPIVEMLEKQESEGSGSSSEGGGSDGGGSSGGEQKGGEQPPMGMKVERLAMYNADGRCGVLDSCAARGVAWVSAPVEKGIVTADVECGSVTVKNVSGRLWKKSVSVTTDARTRSATVKVKAFIEPNGDKFNEINAMNCDNARNAIERGFIEKIEYEIAEAYKLSAALGCDPLFLARQFYRYSPEFFENDYDTGNIDVNIDVEIVLK